MRGTLSILGLLEQNPDLLDDLHYPDGIDGDLLKHSIVLETAELEVLYSDPVFFHYAIDVWSQKELPTWERMYSASLLEYNPIENYDRMEEETEAGTGSRDTEASGHTTGKDERSYRENNYVYGFNSNSEVPQNRVQNFDDSSTYRDAVSTGSETAKDSRERQSRIHGNIGVTTSQQMLKSELELAPELNIINYIVKGFKERFCLLVY